MGRGQHRLQISGIVLELGGRLGQALTEVEPDVVSDNCNVRNDQFGKALNYIRENMHLLVSFCDGGNDISLDNLLNLGPSPNQCVECVPGLPIINHVHRQQAGVVLPCECPVLAL